MTFSCVASQPPGVKCSIVAVYFSRSLPCRWLRCCRAQSFQRFVPFLVDLDGRKGEKADGVSMQMPGNNMDSATRKYTRGNANLEAQVIVGAAAQARFRCSRPASRSKPVTSA